MHGKWSSVYRTTSTQTPGLIAAGSGTGFLLHGCRAVNGALGSVTIGIGASLVWEFTTADAVDGSTFYVPIHFGATDPTVTIAGTAVAYLYYSLY
jgi:hypothetical protein